MLKSQRVFFIKKIIKASKKLKRKIIPMNMTLMLYMFISLVLFKMLIMTSQNSYKMSQNLIKIYRNLYNLQHKSYTLNTISGNCSYFLVTNFCI